MTDPDNTRPRQLIRAAKIGKEAGLRFIYAGNLPGMVGDLENTHCPDCQEIVVERHGYHILGYKVTGDGRCPSCHKAIPGRWAESFRPQITDRPYIPRFARASGLTVA